MSTATPGRGSAVTGSTTSAWTEPVETSVVVTGLANSPRRLAIPRLDGHVHCLQAADEMTLTKPSVDTRMKVLSATPDLVPFPLPWALVPAARPRHPVVDRLRRHQSPMDVLQYPQSPTALRHQGPLGAARLMEEMARSGRSCRPEKDLYEALSEPGKMIRYKFGEGRGRSRTHGGSTRGFPLKP